MPDQTLAAMTAEIRANNISKGHRTADGGPGTNTWGDYIALLHSEVSEALEAYRDHRLADATAWHADETEHHDRMHGLCAHGESRGFCETTRPTKPEGVGSELADVLIRFLDMCDVYGLTPFDMDCGLSDVKPFWVGSHVQSFGDWMSYLHERITDFWNRPDLGSAVLRTLVAVAERYEIDLVFEYERKIAYNRTRPYQHGGRTLADHS